MTSLPEFLEDGCNLDDVRESLPGILPLLARAGVDLEARRISFCGLVVDCNGSAAMFVPKGSLHQHEVSAPHVGHLTMAALAKFGRIAAREGSAEGRSSAGSLPGVVSQLVRSINETGIHDPFRRVQSVNMGKPDWPRTFARETACMTASGNPGYQRIRTSMIKRSPHGNLASIQAAVLVEIYRSHSWWLRECPVPDHDLLDLAQQAGPRNQWPTLLDREMSMTFRDGDIRMIRLLRSYLEVVTGRNGEGAVCGIADFSAVWERMLRDTCTHGTDLTSTLQAPLWKRSDGSFCKSRSPMPDLVLRNGDQTAVIDAKYYAATDPTNCPGTSDIYKQHVYLRAVRDACGGIVRNCFVFPRTGPQEKEFSELSVRYEQPIKCVYLGAVEIMEMWLNGGMQDLLHHPTIFGKT